MRESGSVKLYRGLFFGIGFHFSVFILFDLTGFFICPLFKDSFCVLDLPQSHLLAAQFPRQFSSSFISAMTGACLIVGVSGSLQQSPDCGFVIVNQYLGYHFWIVGQLAAILFPKPILLSKDLIGRQYR
jgi:hypothetical protein